MKHLLLPAMLAGLFSVQSHASEPASRLDRIKDTGVLVAAHGETSIPFSYVGRNGPTGFGVELTMNIADAIKKHLGLPNLEIRWNPVTLSTRFMLVSTRTVDIECITTTNTRKRQEMVAFSNSYYISSEAALLRQGLEIEDPSQLKGKRISVVRNTPSERNLHTMNIGATIVPVLGNKDAINSLEHGSADAYFASAAIIAGQLMQTTSARNYKLVGISGQKEAFACVLPKNDPALKKVVDDAIAGMMSSGQMEKLYNKWFTQPIPPQGRNINMPLSEDNRQLYKMPNDTPFE